ncbi:MAG: hypothetical protein ACRBBR_03720 [Cellvibrionaceae bacterium]
MEIINQPWFAGLILVSIIFGSLGSAFYFWLLALCFGRLKEAFDKDFWITGILTGVIERIFFTCIIASGISGAAISMIAWITIKAQLHFKVFTDEGGDVRRLYLALLGSIGSLLFALAGGMIWKNEINIFFWLN